MLRITEIFFPLFLVAITTQLQQCRSCYGSCRSIPRFIRNIGSIIIPIRYIVIFGRTVIDNEPRYFMSGIQIVLLLSEAITHGITIHSPSLSTRPSGRIGISLKGSFRLYLTAICQIAHHMVGGHVLPKVILQRFVGMRDGYFTIFRIIGLLRSPEQHFKVHHIINNHRITPIAEIPRTNQSDFRTKTGAQAF